MPEWSGEGRRIRGSRCPRCGGELEYNGNYWCSVRACSYVMPGDLERMRRADKHAFNIAYVLMLQNEERADEVRGELLYRDKDGSVL